MAVDRDSDDGVAMTSWRLWIAMTEQAARGDALQAEVDAMTRSRSWRLTAPLRALTRYLSGGSLPARPDLQPAAGPQATRSRTAQWLPVAIADAAERGLAPAWMVEGAGSAPHRLFVDVTELALEDLGAGVQRVTRRVLAAMLAAPRSDLAIEPVRVSADSGFVLARGFLASTLGLPAGCLGDDADFSFGPGDVFLALDFHREHANAVGAAVEALRERGVATCFVAHDALPATHPAWFPPGVAADYDQWLRLVSRSADALMCISGATRDAVLAQLDARALPRPRDGAYVFPLGADPFPATGPSPLPPRASGRTRVLMVGTLEPRKGHQQALEAMDLLWAQSQDFELVLVGRPGWMTEALAQRLRRHPQRGRLLHWFAALDDRALLALYADSDVLLHASHGEGYGLPIAEAGRAGCPLLLRDLAVFREVAGGVADYFHGDEPEDLAKALRRWRESSITGTRTEVQRWHRWTDSAETLVALCAKVAGQRASAGFSEGSFA